MTLRLGRELARSGRRSAIGRIVLAGSSVSAEIASAVPSAPAAASGPRRMDAGSRHSPDTMLAFAREAYNIRRRRARFLPMDLFGEPTWDILLDLYVATRENRPVPTTSACIGANVPPTTALRWLRILEARGLVDREEDVRDGRRTFVRLSEQGLAAMEDWIRTALAAFGSVVAGSLTDDALLTEAAE